MGDELRDFVRRPVTVPVAGGGHRRFRPSQDQQDRWFQSVYADDARTTRRFRDRTIYFTADMMGELPGGELGTAFTSAGEYYRLRFPNSHVKRLLGNAPPQMTALVLKPNKNFAELQYLYSQFKLSVDPDALAFTLFWVPWHSPPSPLVYDFLQWAMHSHVLAQAGPP